MEYLFSDIANNVSIQYYGKNKKKQEKNAPLEKVAIRKRRLQMNRKIVAGKES